MRCSLRSHMHFQSFINGVNHTENHTTGINYSKLTSLYSCQHAGLYNSLNSITTNLPSVCTVTQLIDH